MSYPAHNGFMDASGFIIPWGSAGTINIRHNQNFPLGPGAVRMCAVDFLQEAVGDAHVTTNGADVLTFVTTSASGVLMITPLVSVGGRYPSN
jgi:hypothetical protein